MDTWFTTRQTGRQDNEWMDQEKHWSAENVAFGSGGALLQRLDREQNKKDCVKKEERVKMCSYFFRL